MKNGMMVMTIVVALSFLVSISAVSPSFAKTATQTTPTSKQQPQGTAQTPATQSPQTQKSQFTPPKDQQSSPAKAKFWDFEKNYCSVNGINVFWTNPVSNINVKQAQSITITCYWNVKTPPIKEITEADANYWGTGKSYRTCYSIGGEGGGDYYNTMTTPKFTWSDVKKWQTGPFAKNHPQIWTEKRAYSLAPTMQKRGVVFWPNPSGGQAIPEIDFWNNFIVFTINK